MASLPHLPRDTPAANADILGDEASYDGLPADAAQDRGGEAGSADDRSGPGEQRESDPRPASGDAEAGQNINQAGFVKDPAGGKP